MARPVRLHLPGGFYHVTLRGNHQQPIFFCEADYELLNRIVADALEALAARLHAFCWMTNHLHLLVQVSDAPLGKLIVRIAGRYARRVQRTQETSGHLFERRYHAKIVDADAYFLTLLRYIHWNPVKAGLAADPAGYRWSSHHQYVGRQAWPFVTTSFGLSLLSADSVAARSRYLELVRSDDDCEWGEGSLRPHPDNCQVLGDDDFLARIAAATGCAGPRRSLDGLLSECCERFGVTALNLASPGRGPCLSAARAWLSHKAIAERVATVTEIAWRLGRTDTAIRRLMGRRPLIT
jgi:REP element-mobilizing transposase RayT